MVIKKSHNGEFTPYIRFVDSDGEELFYYDIEQEMGSSAGYPGCIEAVGAVMSILQGGYSSREHNEN